MSLDALAQDVRYAWRTMRRTPGFTAICVGSAAIGIGACSIIVALVTFTLFQQLPVDDAARLLSISEQNVRSGDTGNQLSYPDLRDLRQARAFEGIAGADPLVPASIGVEGDPQRLWGALVTANYFAVVRPRFAIGRGFDPDRDDRAGEAPVVVLSHRFWQTRFQGDPTVVGRTVTVNGRTATVIGVTAAEFRGTELAIVSDFWIPFSMVPALEERKGRVSENRHRHWLEAVGRLRPGVGERDARAELEVIAQRMNAADPESDKARGFHVQQAGRITPAVRGQLVVVLELLLGITLLVLLTACANVANLLLGRASARTREIAARMALGASRGRVVRQLLTESLLLALAGGAGGWIIAAYGASLIGRVRVPLAWPIDLAISLDYRVLLFSIALSVLTGLIFGLVPALRATRLDLVSDLKADARGTTLAPGGSAGRFSGVFGGRIGGWLGLRNGLVVVQVAICTVLLLCTGLFLRSLRTAQDIDLGIGNRNLLLLAFDPSLEPRSDTQARQLLREILDQARAVPGVESATLTSGVPLTLILDNSSFVREEQLTDPKRTRVRTDIYTVAPRFFDTLGIPFRAGQDFAIAADAAPPAPDAAAPAGGRTPAAVPPQATPAGERIAIVNDAFARAVFPGESPIGRRIAGDGKRLRIIGVVGTAKSRTIGEAPRPSIYLPVLTDYTAAQSVAGVTLVVKTRDAAGAYAGPLRDAIRRADATLAVYDIRTMEQHLQSARLVPRLAGLLSTIAGVIGLVIATVGVYGVISFAVARRRREIGIRLAIGARPGEILSMMLRQGLAMTLTGTAVGVLIGLGLTQLLASLLYGIDPRDTITFVIVPAVLMAIALLACLLPARAAARTDPVTVLRNE